MDPGPQAMSVPQPQRVLFAVSGDARPTESLVRAATLAHAMGAELHVVRVVADPNLEVTSVHDTRVHDGAGLRGFLAACRRTQQWCNDALPHQLPEDRWEVRLGSFMAEVVAHAAELRATWIAVAPQWRQPGQLVTELARSAGLPVLFAQPSTSGRAIVAATDLGDHEYSVLLQAASLGKRLGSRLIAVHNLMPASAHTGMDFVRRMAQRKCSDASELREQRLSQVAHQMSAGAESVLASEHDAVDGILNQARSRNAELIVVGTHPHSRLHRMLVGSVSAKLVDRALRAVLVMPLGA